MTIGLIVGAFGVRGELKVELRTDFPGRFKDLHIVYLGPDHREYRVERSRRQPDRVLLKLEGIDSPETARSLRLQEISIPRSEAMPLPKGHYYLEDLLGIEAQATDGRALGTITEVLRTGSNDVFVLGTGRDQILVPAVKDAIHSLDVAARRLVVEEWVLTPDDAAD